MRALNLNPPALISQMLGLQVSTTTLSLFTLLDNRVQGLVDAGQRILQ